MSQDHIPERRRRPDRRASATSPWRAFGFGGHRLRNRREPEHRQPYFCDGVGPATFVVVMMLLALSLLDGVITLQLLDLDCEEINPVMRYLLSHGQAAFLTGKYLLSAAGIPILLIFKNSYLFGTNFRIGYLVPIFAVLYLLLIAYQASLIRTLS